MRKIIKWFLDWWNEIDPIQEAILADYDKWIKQKQKTKQKMAKYRIVETYRHRVHDLQNPGYVIQVLYKHMSPDSVYESWDDLWPVNYNFKETAIEELKNHIKKETLLKERDKVVYETEV
jgi:hypothetical protein